MKPIKQGTPPGPYLREISRWRPMDICVLAIICTILILALWTHQNQDSQVHTVGQHIQECEK